MTTDELFYKEFSQMMLSLKGITGYVNLQDIPMPPEASGHFLKEKHDKVAIGYINDEYYGKLSNSEALLWSNGALRRRKFDYKGEFMKDSNGNFILEDVVCHQDCLPIISDIKLGVPLKYKPQESFEYVDCIVKNTPEKKFVKFLYIVPRKYLYKINQTALVLSWNKLRVYYSGVALSLQNGHILYLYVIPYKPNNVEHNYRVLHCKTSDDYSAEMTLLRDYWLKNNVIFNPNWCQLTEPVKGRDNMAVLRLDGVLDTYERFNTSKSLGEAEEIEDIEFVEDLESVTKNASDGSSNNDDW